MNARFLSTISWNRSQQTNLSHDSSRSWALPRWSCTSVNTGQCVPRYSPDAHAAQNQERSSKPARWTSVYSPPEDWIFHKVVGWECQCPPIRHQHHHDELPNAGWSSLLVSVRAKTFTAQWKWQHAPAWPMSFTLAEMRSSLQPKKERALIALISLVQVPAHHFHRCYFNAFKRCAFHSVQQCNSAMTPWDFNKWVALEVGNPQTSTEPIADRWEHLKWWTQIRSWWRPIWDQVSPPPHLPASRAVAVWMFRSNTKDL